MKYNKVYCISGAQVLPSPPGGLAFLSGCCETLGINHDILDFNMYIMDIVGKQGWYDLYTYSYNHKLDSVSMPHKLWSKVEYILDNAVEKIKKAEPDLIAISILSYFQLQWCELLCVAIKKKLKVDIIIGGPGVSNETSFQTKSFGQLMVAKGAIDFYVIGEGDYVFKNFLLESKNAKWVNNKKSAILGDQVVPQISDLDPLVWPNWKKFDFSIYSGQPEIAVTGSRGCVRKCTFCDVANLWEKFKFRSGKNIADEILRHYQETGIATFKFNDSLINGSLKQFFEMMTELAKFKKEGVIPDLTYSGNFIIRPKAYHTEQLFQLLHESGGTSLTCSIEAGSARVREHMGKKFSNDDIYWHLEQSAKYRIKNVIGIFPGYPTETLEDFDETLEVISNSKKYAIADNLSYNVGRPCLLLKDTPLYNKREELGISLAESSNDADTHSEDLMNRWTYDKNPQLTIYERLRRWTEIYKLLLETKLVYNHEVFSDVENQIEMNYILLNESHKIEKDAEK